MKYTWCNSALGVYEIKKISDCSVLRNSPIRSLDRHHLAHSAIKAVQSSSLIPPVTLAQFRLIGRLWARVDGHKGCGGPAETDAAAGIRTSFNCAPDCVKSTFSAVLWWAVTQPLIEGAWRRRGFAAGVCGWSAHDIRKMSGYYVEGGRLQKYIQQTGSETRSAVTKTNWLYTHTHTYADQFLFKVHDNKYSAGPFAGSECMWQE